MEIGSSANADGLPTCQTGQALRLGLEALSKVKLPGIGEKSVGNDFGLLPSTFHHPSINTAWERRMKLLPKRSTQKTHHLRFVACLTSDLPAIGNPDDTCAWLQRIVKSFLFLIDRKSEGRLTKS